MSDVGPYGVTQNADAAMVTANQLVGQRVGLAIGNAVSPDVGPALHSTAPYKRPKPRIRGVHGCYAKEGTCRAAAMHGFDYCVYHNPDYAPERREPPTTA